MRVLSSVYCLGLWRCGPPPVAAVTAAVKVDAHSFTRTQRDTTALDTKTLGSWHLL